MDVSDYARQEMSGTASTGPQVLVVTSLGRNR